MSQSVSRALTLLRVLADGPRSLDELAAHLDVHKTTVLRLLRAMEAERFVQHDHEHRYRLGSTLFELSNRSLEQRDIRTLARPYLATLNAETKQTIHLATYESGRPSTSTSSTPPRACGCTPVSDARPRCTAPPSERS